MNIFNNESFFPSTGIAENVTYYESSEAVHNNMSKGTELSDMEIANKIDMIMSSVIAPIFCIPGMAMNILSIIVWNRRGMLNSTARYLTAQAISDFFVLFFFIINDSLTKWAPSILTSYSFAVFFCYIGYPFLFWAVIESIWVTVGVTVDRYIMVCWITKSKRYCSTKRANVGLILITINCFLINIPHFASFKPVHSDNDSMAFMPTKFGGGDGGRFYEFWVHCIFLVLVPWFSVFYMNMMIIHKISKSNQKMSENKSSQSMKKSKESENQITRLLLTVTFTFLLFIGIQCVVQCFFMLQPDGMNLALVKGAFAFAKCGIVFNSSMNFLLYCCSGKRFRKELMKLFSRSRQEYSMTSSYENKSMSGPTSGTSTTGI